MKRYIENTDGTRHALPLRFERRDVNVAQRVVTASLSSDTPVERWFGVEVLEHKRGSIDFSRARDGLPLLAYHDTHQPIGRAENIRLEKGKLRAELRFSAEDDAAKIWRLIEDGTLRDTSLGYKILDFVELDGEEEGVRITRWTPIECSIVTTPADPNVGINRSFEEKTMTDVETQDPTPNNVVDFTKGEKAERKRVTEIQRLFNRPLFRDRRYKDLEQRCVTEGVAIEQARELLLEEMGRGIEPSNDLVIQAPGSHFGAT